MSLGTLAQGHFTQILSDLGRTVSYSAVTITEDGYGNRETTYAAGTDKTWIFLKRNQRYLFDKEGLVELGDAYIMIPNTDSISVFDRITMDGETYEVTGSGGNPIMVRHFNGATAYKYATLKKLSGTQT